MPRPLLRPPVFVLAVDLVGCGEAGEYRLSGKRLAIAEIARRFDEFGLPATWLIDGGAECRLAAPLLDLGGEHEIALAADSSWVGRSVCRKTFASGLSTRQLRARANGFSVTSLFLDDAQDLVHTDLALKYGISAVCPVAGGRRRTRQVSRSARGPHDMTPRTDSLQTICFGLWQVPISLVWSARGRVFRRMRVGRELCRALEGSVASAGAALILMDIEELAGSTGRRGGALKKALRKIEAHRRAERIEVDTLAGLVRRLSVSKRTVPARSILRRAA